MPYEPDGDNQLREAEKGTQSDDKTTSSATEKPKKKGRISSYRFRVYTLIFDGLLVVVGAIYSFFAYQQWQAMKKQVTIESRAWVALVEITPISKPQENNPYQIKIRIENSGKSFAKNVRLVTRLGIIPSGQRADFSNEATTEWNSKGLLPPGTSLTQTMSPYQSKNLTREQADAINFGTMAVFISGKVLYYDIFHCEHWSTFCYSLIPSSGDYEACKEHNEADDSRCP